MSSSNSNIKDVARRAGVSIATVSHVLNNTKPVSESTRVQVLKAVEGLNYIPNQSARGLKGKNMLPYSIIIDERIISEYTNFIMPIVYHIQSLNPNPVSVRILSEIDVTTLSKLATQCSQLFVITAVSSNDNFYVEENITFFNLSSEIFIFSSNIINIYCDYITKVTELINSNNYTKILLTYSIFEKLKNNINESSYERFVVTSDEIGSGFYEVSRIFDTKLTENILIISPSIARGCIKFLIMHEQELYLQDISFTTYLFNQQVETFTLPIMCNYYEISSLINKNLK